MYRGYLLLEEPLSCHIKIRNRGVMGRVTDRISFTFFFFTIYLGNYKISISFVWRLLFYSIHYYIVFLSNIHPFYLVHTLLLYRQTGTEYGSRLVFHCKLMYKMFTYRSPLETFIRSIILEDLSCLVVNRFCKKRKL